MLTKLKIEANMESRAVQDYLKEIYALQSHGTKVSTTMVAERVRVTPPSATLMVKRLAELGLVEHIPYQGVALSGKGEKVALEVIRHHRLVEQFLAEVLGMPWDEVHDEAERWEHVLSEDVEGRIDAVLGHPTNDPHGAPIPAPDGAIDLRESVRMPDLGPGEGGTVAEVSDDDPDLLRYLGTLGLFPGAEIELLELAPFDGPLTIRVAGMTHVLGRTAAGHVRVTES